MLHSTKSEESQNLPDSELRFTLTLVASFQKKQKKPSRQNTSRIALTSAVRTSRARFSLSVQGCITKTGCSTKCPKLSWSNDWNMGPESQTHVQKYAHMKMKKNEPMQDVIQNGRFDQFEVFDQGKLCNRTQERNIVVANGTRQCKTLTLMIL